MQPSLLTGSAGRKPTQITDNEGVLIEYEAFLRKTAYKNSPIKTDDSFFDDSDMLSDYYLTVVYDQLSNTPLLSSRYYFDKTVIEKYLKGDLQSEPNLTYKGEKFNLHAYPSHTIFLADRLSGNTDHVIYKPNRSTIFALYYSEIVTRNKNCFLLLMVRQTEEDKQLKNYLQLGFERMGSTLHKGKAHHIIMADLKNANH
jgi:hypothetical protein